MLRAFKRVELQEDSINLKLIETPLNQGNLAPHLHKTGYPAINYGRIVTIRAMKAGGY